MDQKNEGININRFTVSEEMDGERIDKLLSEVFPEHSRSFLQKLIKDGSVQVDEHSVKASFRVQEGESILLSVPEKIIPDIPAENIPLDILYEDNSVLVVNKPKNMVVHPAPGHYSGTLVNAVMYHCGASLSGINGVLRPGIVHRIDRDTTGSLIICKNDKAHAAIAAQLKEHTVVRKYYAICCGVLKDEALVIDKPIGRDPKDRLKMAVIPSGKHAVTHVRVLQRFADFTYVECILETGRTHQIRVHMASVGHPLLGDETYAKGRKWPFKGLQGQCLHAGVLGFRHPDTGDYIETQAPLPDYFQKLLDVL